MTFKHYNPHTKKAVWKSVNTSALKTDGRSSKTDAFVRALATFPPALGPALPLSSMSLSLFCVILPTQWPELPPPLTFYRHLSLWIETLPDPTRWC